MTKNNLNILLIHPEISRTKYNFVGVIENECLELEYISSLMKENGIPRIMNTPKGNISPERSLRWYGRADSIKIWQYCSVPAMGLDFWQKN